MRTKNLQQLFSPREISQAFKVLKQRQFRKDFSELKRYSTRAEKELNSLGIFLKTTDPTAYYSGLETFSFSPYLGMRIEKSKNKYRPLLIPKPADRVILAAALPKIKTRLEDVLKQHSALGLGIAKVKKGDEFGRTLSRIVSMMQAGSFKFALKLDFKDFFSSIDREQLLKKLHPYFKTSDALLFELIQSSIQNPIEADSVFWREFKNLHLKKVGIPQGLSYSPLLASFYATSLDDITVGNPDLASFRYLDDMIVFTKTKKSAQVLYSIIKAQSRALKLRLHPLSKGEKTKLVNIKKQKVVFLGVEIDRGGLYIPHEAIENFKSTFIKEIVNQGTVSEYSLSEIIKIYKSYARGWVNHYKRLCPDHFQEIEPELNDFLVKHIEKYRTRKTIKAFFGSLRLTITSPFIKLVGA